MAEVVNSLFGITPESLMAERENALQQQAMQYAKMDPFQRATAGIYAGANRLGGAVGGLLGALLDADRLEAGGFNLLMEIKNNPHGHGELLNHNARRNARPYHFDTLHSLPLPPHAA